MTFDSEASTLHVDLHGNGHALFTTCAHGNLSSVGGLGRGHGHDARERLRAQLGLRRMARGYQVHGTTVLCSRTDPDIPEQDSATTQPPIEADGQATSIAGIGAMVLTADCLPVALGIDGAVAMVHAGWRGLAAGVLEEGVRAVRELGGEGELVAVIGPGAGPCCYEVGEEVHAAFGGVHRMDPGPPPRRRGRPAANRPEGDRARPAAGGGSHRSAGPSRVHDLRRALLLLPPRRRSRRTAGRGGMVELISNLRADTVRANLAEVREQVATAARCAPDETRGGGGSGRDQVRLSGRPAGAGRGGGRARR